MNDQDTVPEICCAKCGFLYALNRDGGKIFDPDLIRKPNYITENSNTENFEISTQFLAAQRPGMWQDPFRLICFEDVVQPFTSRPRERKERIKATEDFLTKDRALGENICTKFFPYHPGFSPKEHAEIQLQEKREQEQQEFQERQNKLFLQLETTAAERDLFWKQKIEKADQKEDRDRSLDRWITIIFAVLATIISFINLINTFRNPNP